MLKRIMEDSLQLLAGQVPVVTLLGPRQSGKTTLVKDVFPHYTYANLEDPVTRMLAQDDPVGFFATYPEPLIIDEVQRVPQLLSTIQVKVDQDRTKNGRFILTGSHQPRLHEGISQSLAGRTSLLTLLPLSMAELKTAGHLESTSLDSLMLRGFMPELYRPHVRPAHVFYRDYLNTYVERDLRELGQVQNLDAFLRFVRLLAGRVGQVVNLNSLSGEVGVSAPTLTKWLSVLEASFVVFKLPPYFSNVNKRHVKSAKIFFTEVGLAAYLLGIETETQMSRDPLRGNLFENLVVAEAFKARLNRNNEPSLYFMRTEGGVEIDLILQREGMLMPCEIKSAMTPNKGFARHLSAFMNAEKNNAVDPTVIYAGQDYPQFAGARYVNFEDASQLF